MKGIPRGLRDPCLFATLAAALLCSDTAARGQAASPAELLSFPPESQLEPLAWSTLKGWQEDDHAAAFAAFQSSCNPLAARLKWRLRKNREPRDSRPIYAALAEVCARAVETEPADDAAARAFFEENFRPVKVGNLGEETGLLTGYYEPVIEGSRFPSDEYVVPVYAPPSNLVVGGRTYSEGQKFPNKGRVGRRVGRKVVPYYERGEIEDGVLAGQGYEICWLKDPIDAFFMQIQGSARVKLDTGKTLRLNYAAHNGHAYTPVGRLLIARNQVSKEDMSMDRIREWMERDPEAGKELRRENRSYVFMRETGLADDVEPTGAQGIPLTPGRSIAVDRKLHVYGTPFFITAALPIDSEKPVTPFHRLMVAQDTGSAIIGVARADIYWGAGDEPGRIAGRIKQQGQFVMLVPTALDPGRFAAKLPLPPPRSPEAGPRVLVATASDPEISTVALAYAPADKPANDSASAAVAAVAAHPAPAPPAAAASGGAAGTVPMPPSRPEMMLEASLKELPDWFRHLQSPPTAAPPARSFASAEAAIAAAMAAPADFAAPAITQAAQSMVWEAKPANATPMPSPRPQKGASAKQ